jgi:hypothetical protein
VIDVSFNGLALTRAGDKHARMARILVTEEIAEGGLDRLRAAGHVVDVRVELTPTQLLAEVSDA